MPHSPRPSSKPQDQSISSLNKILFKGIKDLKILTSQPHLRGRSPPADKAQTQAQNPEAFKAPMFEFTGTTGTSKSNSAASPRPEPSPSRKKVVYKLREVLDAFQIPRDEVRTLNVLPGMPAPSFHEEVSDYEQDHLTEATCLSP